MKTVKNIIYQLINLAGSKVVMYLFYIVLARCVSVGDFGLYNYITLYAIFWSVLMDFGFEPYIARQVAAGENKAELFKRNLPLKLLFLFLGFIGLVVLSPLFMIKNWQIVLLAAVAFSADSMTRYMFAFMRGAQDLRYESVITFCQKIIFVIAGISLLFYTRQIFTIFFLLAITNSVFVLVSFIVLRKKYQIDIGYIIDLEEWRNKIRYLMPFFFISFFSLIYFKIDIFMLKYFSNDYKVGIYSAAYRLLESFQMIPAAILVALFPGMVISALESEEKFKALFEKVLSVLLGAGFLIVTSGWLYGDIAIKLLYGAKYNDSIAVFYVLIFAIFFMYINYLLTQSLIALEKQKVYSKWVIICALFNAGINFLLIPRYGATGAAIATGLTEVVLFLLISPTFKGFEKSINWKYNGLLVILWAIDFIIAEACKSVNILVSILLYLILSSIIIILLIKKYMPEQAVMFKFRKGN